MGDSPASAPSSCGRTGRPTTARPGTKEHFLEALAQDWPQELERYEQLYAQRAYLPRAEVDPVRDQVRSLAREHGVGDRRSRPLAPPPEPVQLTLGV